MTPAGARLLRRGLLAGVLFVSLAVAWTLRRPATEPAPPPTPTGSPGQGTTFGELVYLRFREGKESVQVKARAMTGREGAAMRLEGVELTFPFVTRGEASRATVTADESLYDPDRQGATFRGHVHVTTEDGFVLDTESLEYRGDEEVATTPGPVRFQRRSASGTARGLEYSGTGGRLELHSEVRLRFEKAGGAPTEVESGQAVALRGGSAIDFSGGVRVRQGKSELAAERLKVELDDELEGITRAMAIEQVDVRSADAGPETPGEARGLRHLRCRRLEVFFRENGALASATAVNRASLVLEPGPGEPRERRRIEAYLLHFTFDGEGRLQSLSGRRGGPRVREKGPEVVLTTEPIPPATTGQRRVACHTFGARVAPTTGRLESAEFGGDVAFSEPGRRASAQRAQYDEARGWLTLLDRPRIVDEREGSELRAQRIELGTRAGTVAARGEVQHTLTRRAKGRSGLLSGEQPTLLRSGTLDYDERGRVARYRDGALLRAGRDEIRAAEIVIEERAPDRRRLLARGDVVSLLHPRPARGARRDPAPVEAHSEEMVFEEAEGRVVYRGEVVMRQGDLRTRSPEAVVTLGEDGGSVKTMVAGEPVELEQGRRRATGRQGTYTPETETVVLVGDRVVLEDADRRVEGKVLIFRVGEDRIQVDGREEARTEAIFKRREAPPP